MYAGKMDKITGPIKEKHGITLILTRDEARPQMTELIASLVLNGRLFVVSAGEWLPSFILSRTIRRRGADTRNVSGGLRLARTSTCHRLLDTLSNLPRGSETILIVDFLDTFYDPDVPLSTRFFGLRQCCRRLKQSAVSHPVIIMMQEVPTEDYRRFSPILHGIADRTLHLEPETQPSHGTQPGLF
jgi:hypothetical protein